MENSERDTFVPYADNGGTVVAIAGDDYVVIGADTRLVLHHTIMNRNEDKLFKLSPTIVLGTCGCWADVLAFTTALKLRVDTYVYDNHKPISTTALAQLLSVTLYYKRFFPYFISNVLAGLDEDGKGVTYVYDPIGSHEKNYFAATGSAGALLQPLLDNQLARKQPINEKKAICLLKDGFTSAAEREVSTGDCLQIFCIKRGKEIREHRFPLRKD